jgi:hypothetical protein
LTPSAGSYFSRKLDITAIPAKGYLGVFAKEAIAADELLVLWGGDIVSAATLATFDDARRSHSLQVEEDLFLAATVEEDADFVNHSCDPNAWIDGQTALRARRHIAVGDEVCYDYAMTDGSDYDEFECLCESSICRGKVTGRDWSLPELQARYGRHFSPYLLRRMGN